MGKLDCRTRRKYINRQWHGTQIQQHKRKDSCHYNNTALLTEYHTDNTIICSMVSMRCEDGLKKYVNNNVNNYTDSVSHRDIFYLIMLLCKLFGNSDYSHHRSGMFRIFCENNSVSRNAYHKLPKFAATTIMHSLKLDFNCINGLSDVDKYLLKHAISCNTQYEQSLGEMLTDMNIIRQVLFASIGNDLLFVHLQRYRINSNITFKIAAQKLSNNVTLRTIIIYLLHTIGTQPYGCNTDHITFKSLYSDYNHITQHLACENCNEHVIDDETCQGIYQLCCCLRMFGECFGIFSEWYSLEI